VVEIEVPNYKIEELIKAGFKGSGEVNTQINVLLKKPEQSVDAQIQDINSQIGTPQVNLQYEPVQPVKVHYPTDKQYSPLSGPLVPPGGGSAPGGGGGGGGGGSGRYTRGGNNPRVNNNLHHAVPARRY